MGNKAVGVGGGGGKGVDRRKERQSGALPDLTMKASLQMLRSHTHIVAGAAC